MRTVSSNLTLSETVHLNESSADFILEPFQGAAGRAVEILSDSDTIEPTDIPPIISERPEWRWPLRILNVLPTLCT